MLPQSEDNPCKCPDEKPIENYEDGRAAKPRPESSQSVSKPGKGLDKRRSKTSGGDKDLGRLHELSGNRGERRGIVHVALLPLVLFDLRANRAQLFLNCQHVLDIRSFLQEPYQLHFFCPKNLESRLNIYVLRC